jgi:hypothetical protein
MFKVFQVTTQNLEKNSKNNVYRVISFEFKFEFLTFKWSFKWKSAYNKSCRFWNFWTTFVFKIFRVATENFEKSGSQTRWPLFISLSLSSLSLPPLFCIPRASVRARWPRGRRCLCCCPATCAASKGEPDRPPAPYPIPTAVSPTASRHHFAARRRVTLLPASNGRPSRPRLADCAAASEGPERRPEEGEWEPI